MATLIVDPVRLAEVLGPMRLELGRVESIARSITGRAPKALRLNRLAGVKPAALDMPLEPVPWLPGWGYWPASEVPVGQTIAFGAGLYYVQDAGSMLPVALLDVQPGELVCDTCAAPGGKATAILEALGPTGGVLANEAVRGRVESLRLNLARQGASRFVVTAFDPDDLADLAPEAFDAVLVDAPCTGQSLVAAGKQSASAFEPRWIDHSAARQCRILDAAARLVRPGGRLVYSTCTFSWAENEARVEQFLADHSDFALSPDDRLAPWQSPEPSPAGCYRIWPDCDRSAGAFAARLVRRPTSADSGPSVGGRVPGPSLLAADAGRRADRGRRRPAGRSGEPPVPWSDWGEWTGPVQMVSTASRQVGAIPADLPGVLQQIAQATGVAGLPEAAERFGKVWQPAHALAMRRDGAFAARQAVALSADQARACLRGETIRTEVRRWAVATWQGWPLGWLHGTGLVANNKLDKLARLTAPV